MAVRWNQQHFGRIGCGIFIQRLFKTSNCSPLISRKKYSLSMFVVSVLQATINIGTGVLFFFHFSFFSISDAPESTNCFGQAIFRSTKPFHWPTSSFGFDQYLEFSNLVLLYCKFWKITADFYCYGKFCYIEWSWLPTTSFYLPLLF